MKDKSILVIAAHPDDEALGCGGTIARHAEEGAKVQVLFVADGVSSRGEEKGISERYDAAREACRILGVCEPFFLNLPDNRLDSIPLLEVVQKIEEHLASCDPQIIYTHHPGDLNIDHAIVYRAVMTACRPQPGCSVKEIYSFEVPSSTGWLPHGSNGSFQPNCFIDVSATLEKKLAALRAYEMEMRAFPHSRSYENVDYLARYRGAEVGVEAAEAFMVERILRGAA